MFVSEIPPKKSQAHKNKITIVIIKQGHKVCTCFPSAYFAVVDTPLVSIFVKDTEV